jgi:3D (Asp-Asp-Asp) domain-containing protein
MTAGQPFAQDLVLTAYYSPLPDQCCYVKGGFQEDVILNGQGTNGADGTEVYPGMVAAPPSYPFGTRIEIPGLGTFTVHDRGGAIQEQGAIHRLDVWAGAGEEGLARALAFGVKRMRATIYPPSSEKPQESFSLASLRAPPEYLRPYVVAHREWILRSGNGAGARFFLP